MHSVFTKGLTKEQKSAIIQKLKAHKEAFEIIHEAIGKLKSQKKFVPDYTNPAWPYEQAHMNGKLETYEEIQNILKGILNE